MLIFKKTNSFCIMISLIIYSTVYCFLPPVSCCMTFIPASPLRSSRNRRWLPWLKSSAADSSRDKVCHFLRSELLTSSSFNGCVKNQAQMCTVSNNHQPLLCEVLQSISCLLLNGWDHTKRSVIWWVIFLSSTGVGRQLFPLYFMTSKGVALL